MGKADGANTGVCLARRLGARDPPPPPPPAPSQELQDMAWVTTKKLWLGAHYPSQHAQWIGHSELMLKKTAMCSCMTTESITSPYTLRHPY